MIAREAMEDLARWLAVTIHKRGTIYTTGTHSHGTFAVGQLSSDDYFVAIFVDSLADLDAVEPQVESFIIPLEEVEAMGAAQKKGYHPMSILDALARFGVKHGGDDAEEKKS